MLELRMVVDACARKIQIPGILWINSRECESCGTRLRLGKHGFQEYPGPAGAPPARRWRQVCFFLNYTPGCQGFCGLVWRKTLQDREMRFIRERVSLARLGG